MSTPALQSGRVSIPLDLPTIRRSLAGREPRPLDGEGVAARAAVAAILRPGVPDPEVLLIRRAEKPGDPWSGHMAFPGGRAAPDDRDLLATAIRETREEVGLDLSRDAELAGVLDDIPAVSRGRLTGMVIRPFVFALPVRECELTTNDEVDEAHWVPLGPLLRDELATTHEYPLDGRTITLPGWRVGERVVWGLTYHMLQAFFAALRGTPAT
jgi:8-oxo-dGTP pyrophosphatase MutT (NUDIX family)